MECSIITTPIRKTVDDNGMLYDPDIHSGGPMYMDALLMRVSALLIKTTDLRKATEY